MALIKCPECSKDVSDKAPACPNCGAPIAAASVDKKVGVDVTTIQETSKRLKAQMLLSILSLLWASFGSFSPPARPNEARWHSRLSCSSAALSGMR